MKWDGNRYEVTQSCGHTTFVVTTDEDIATAATKEICDNCKLMEAFNVDNGLCTLVGSSAQVRWANDIRKKHFTMLNAVISSNHNVGREVSHTFKEAYEALKNEVDASFFIDTRSKQTKVFFADYIKKMSEKPVVKSDEELAAEEVILKPEKQTEMLPAEINVLSDGVVVSFKKHEGVNALLKRLDYRWDRDNHHWHKVTTSEVLDRAAEVGARILRLGVPLIVHNASVREKIMAMDFRVENFNIIQYRDGKFIVRCEDADVGNQLKAFMGAIKLADGMYSVRSIYARDLSDFATEHKFEFSEDASAYIDGLAQRKEVVISDDLLSDLLDE